MPRLPWIHRPIARSSAFVVALAAACGVAQAAPPKPAVVAKTKKGPSSAKPDIVAKKKTAQAKPSTQVFPTQPPWCAPELEALPLREDVCFVDGTREPKEGEGKRTLVIYLHGLIAKKTTWQWTQERAIARQAKQFGFAAIVPQAPSIGKDGSAGFGWPTAAKSQGVEPDLIAGWESARRLLEERSGRTFDEVFVIGFSSGAYYGSSLALRGRLDVDGYALLAGGSPVTNPVQGARRAPVFIGVAARDAGTAPGARTLGQSLARWGWPHKVDEQPVGHMSSDVHVGHALAYLRAMARSKS